MTTSALLTQEKIFAMATSAFTGGVEVVGEKTRTGANSGVQTLHYRPDIDDLRALAVLAVIGFHSQPGVGGGVVGARGSLQHRGKIRNRREQS
jgi:hypothetical protein